MVTWRTPAPRNLSDEAKQRLTFDSVGRKLRGATQLMTANERLALGVKDLYDGITVYERDTDRVWMHDGTGWIIMHEPTQTNTPTVVSLTGSITTVGTCSTSYRRSGGWCNWSTSIAVTNNGTGGGLLLFTLPVTPLASPMALGSGLNASTGVADSVNNGVLGPEVRTATGAYPIASGQTIVLSGLFPMSSPYS